jgi:hypothetical protein
MLCCRASTANWTRAAATQWPAAALNHRSLVTFRRGCGVAWWLGVVSGMIAACDPSADGGGAVDVADVWIANDEGTEIIRARDIAGASLDYDGNVTVRLTGGDGAIVTVAGHRAHHEEHRPADFHRQLIRVIIELEDAAGAFVVRAEYHETRGWQWVTGAL